MNRDDAKKIAETVSESDLKHMLVDAYRTIKNWNVPSNINKGISKGAAFNIYTKINIDRDTHILAKINMIREFGEFLPNYQKKETIKKTPESFYHEEPKKPSKKFLGYDIEL